MTSGFPGNLTIGLQGSFDSRMKPNALMNLKSRLNSNILAEEPKSNSRGGTLTVKKLKKDAMGKIFKQIDLNYSDANVSKIFAEIEGDL